MEMIPFHPEIISIEEYEGGENQMTNYTNLNGNSGIRGYIIANDYIIVEFNDFSKYKYSYASAETTNIENMKQLATQGWGLNSFIMRNVRTSYEARLN